MDAYVGAPGLPAVRRGELMAVCGQLPEAVDGSGRPMGYQPLRWGTRPSRGIGRELEPGCPQVELLWYRCPRQPVYPVRHPFEQRARRGQAIECGLWHASQFGLSPGDQSPLVLRDLGESL